MWHRGVLFPALHGEHIFEKRAPKEQITIIFDYPAEFGHTLELFFGRGVPKSIFARSGSKSVFRTHKYHQNTRNFETNPMGPVPGSETHISRKKSFNFLIGARILVGITQVTMERHLTRSTPGRVGGLWEAP